MTTMVPRLRKVTLVLRMVRMIRRYEIARGYERYDSTIDTTVHNSMKRYDGTEATIDTMVQTNMRGYKRYNGTKPTTV